MKDRVVVASALTAIKSIRDKKYVGTEVGNLLLETLAESTLSEDQLKEKLENLVTDTNFSSN